MNYKNQSDIVSKSKSQDLGYVTTPRKVALQMAHELLDNDIKNWNGKIPDDFNLIDPCCGTGNLTKACFEVFIENGYDINTELKDHFWLFDVLEDNIEEIKKDSELKGVHLALMDILNDDCYNLDNILWDNNELNTWKKRAIMYQEKIKELTGVKVFIKKKAPEKKEKAIAFNSWRNKT